MISLQIRVSRECKRYLYPAIMKQELPVLDFDASVSYLSGFFYRIQPLCQSVWSAHLQNKQIIVVHFANIHRLCACISKSLFYIHTSRQVAYKYHVH